MATATGPAREDSWTQDDLDAALARHPAQRVERNTTSSPRFDPVALIRALNTTGLPYVVIGGLAVAAHGSPRRTEDLDLMGLRLDDWLGPISEMLRRLEAQPYEGGVAAGRLTPQWLRARPRFPLLELHTSIGGIDLDDYGDEVYQKVSQGSLEITFGADVARFVGLKDLIWLKRLAGRPQDLADIAALERIRDLQK